MRPPPCCSVWFSSPIFRGRLRGQKVDTGSDALGLPRHHRGGGIEETLKTALRLHPGTREVVVIGSTGNATGAMNDRLVRSAISTFRNQVKFRFWNNCTMEDVLAEIPGLRPGSLVLLTSTLSEGGRVLDFGETCERLRQHLPVPLYGLWDFFLEKGIVGGKLISSHGQGRMAAEMALRIIDGADPDSLPFLRNEANEYLFDFKELTRFNVSIAHLPEHSRIVNRPSPFYAIKKSYLWSGLVTISALSMACIILMLHLFYRRRSAAALAESERRYREFIEGTSDLVVRVDSRGDYLFVNPTAERILGLTSEECLGQSAFSFVHPDDRQRTEESFASWINERRRHASFENRIVSRNGEVHHLLWSIHLYLNRDGTVRTVSGVGTDITDRIQAEEALRFSEERFRSIFENAGVGMNTIDPCGRYLQVNAAFCAFLGYSGEELLTLDVMAVTHPEDRPLTEKLFEEMRSGRRQHFHYEKRFVHRKGHTVWGEVTTAWVLDGNGSPLYGIGLVQDISARKQAERRLDEKDGHIQYLTHVDALTNLPNRALLQDRIDHALAKALRSGTQVGLLFLDLDRFKKINESLGHEGGDQVLTEIAKRLNSVVRTADTVGRFGGDKFIALVEEVEDLKKVTIVAQKILSILEKPIHILDQQIFVSASLGISMFPGDAQDAQGLLQNAEAAMYRVKKEGKNSFQFFKPQMNQRSREMLILESALRQALFQEQFVLHYQPQLDLSTGNIVGVEALLRWEHPSMGTILPGDFISLAEETGLILPIGRWVLETACRQVRQWQRPGHPPLRLAVNVSPREFRQPEMVGQVLETLEKTGFDPTLLELEITESMITTDMEEAVERMKLLSGRGIRFAIDDFGTGHSSVNRLQLFPLNTLKIDRTYVRNIVENPKDAAIAASIISLAHNLDLQVVAEGIETPEQQEFFKERQCAWGQGFLFCRPLPPERMEEVLGRFTSN